MHSSTSDHRRHHPALGLASLAVLASVALHGLAVGPGRAGDAPAWSSGFHVNGPDWYVNALAEYDDGNGRALYAVGSFSTAGGAEASRIAKWDGVAWSALSGPAGNGLDGSVVSALAVFDDGGGPALYAGGTFTSAGGVAANNVARWDGSSWAPLTAPSGNGTNGHVYALTVFDDGTGRALYAGGDFTTAGGVEALYVARWDGSAWSAFGASGDPGTNAVVYSLEVYDDGIEGPALFAGGGFTSAGGVAANHVARWDGTSWAPLAGPSGNGLDDSAWALTAFDDGTGSSLYAGGFFSTAGGSAANGVARWDGTSWAPLVGPSGNGVEGGGVRKLVAYDDGGGGALYAAGSFLAAGGTAASYIARWDGSSWAPLEGPSGNEIGPEIFALTVYDDGTGPRLLAGGTFVEVGTVAAIRIAAWNGTSWGPLGAAMGYGLDVPPGPFSIYHDGRCATVHNGGDGPALYVGGIFTAAGGAATSQIAKWDGVAWWPLSGPLGNGMDHYVDTLAIYDDGTGPALYAGGGFETAGGIEARHVAEWRNGAWSPLAGLSGNGTNDAVFELVVYDDGAGPALYAGGRFSFAGGVEAQHVARWREGAWEPLSGPSENGTSGDVRALAVYDAGAGTDLYAGGNFQTAGGVTVANVARWDGTTWWPLAGPGTGTNGEVYELAVYDDGTGAALYVGGDFTTTGGVTVNHVARWDGASWSPLTGPSGTGTDGWVSALVVHDDGQGPALYVGGSFSSAGGVEASHVARWDGSEWTPLVGPWDNGFSSHVSDLVVFDDGLGPSLFAVGHFWSAGGVASHRIARWSSSPLPLIFRDGFESGDRRAWSSAAEALD